MSVWRRIFGLDAFDVLLQSVITGVLIFWAAAVNSHQDALVIGCGVAVTSLVVLGVRRRIALGRQERNSLSESESARVADLEQRVAELEHELGRVVELEERMDFAERLLAAPRQPAKELAP